MFTTPTRRWRGRRVLGTASILFAGLGLFIWLPGGEKRFAVVTPGQIYRGAWQQPETLRSLIRREKIQTVLSLTAINRTDPKYVGQERIARDEKIRWIIVPMRGSTATPEQMALAADIATDPRRQPVFFHCVAGHHRSNLVHAAIRIRHQGWSARDVLSELAQLPWTRPEAKSDLQDRALIERFAVIQGSIPRASVDDVREFTHADSRQTGSAVDPSPTDCVVTPGHSLDRLDPNQLEFRGGSTLQGLPRLADVGVDTG